MSYENDRQAFNRTAERIKKAARLRGDNMSHDEAKEHLRRHIKRSNNK